MARLGRKNIALLIAAVLVAVLAYAWFNAGREPLHEIAEDIAVPGAVN